MCALMCPNCRERLSSVEEGLGGLWSCLYCEGTWLSEEQTDQLLARHPGWLADGATNAGDDRGLPCASCEDSLLQALSRGELTGHWCARCRGAFFDKGLVQRLAPELASTAAEAPVLAVMLAAASGAAFWADPLLWAAPRSRKPRP